MLSSILEDVLREAVELIASSERCPVSCSFALNVLMLSDGVYHHNLVLHSNSELHSLSSKALKVYVCGLEAHAYHLDLLLEQLDARREVVQGILHDIKTVNALVQKMKSIYPTPLTPSETKRLWTSQQQISKLLNTHTPVEDLANDFVTVQNTMLALVKLIKSKLPKKQASLVEELQGTLTGG